MKTLLFALAVALVVLGCGGGGGNSAPTAFDQVVAAATDTDTPITLTASDPQGDTLTYVIVDAPSHGALDTLLIPEVIYRSDPSFAGVDSFTFRVNDGILDSNLATVLIGVDNTAPTASSSNHSTNEDEPVAITLQASDPDGDSLLWTIVANPSHGSLSGTAPDLTYTPDADYNGPDAFSFQVSDRLAQSGIGTADITVNPQNDPPTAQDIAEETARDVPVDVVMLGSDIDGDTPTYEILSLPAHGNLTGSGDTRTYTPSADYYGPDSFTYRVYDGQVYSGTHTVTLNVLKGTVWCWGSNTHGQLGDGTKSNSNRPIRVRGLGDVVAVAAGGDHVAAVKEDGTVWTWGSNTSGQLGRGSLYSDQLTPGQVPGISGVGSVSAGTEFTLVLKSDGTVWGWGRNSEGQLGNATNNQAASPVQAAGLTSVVSISAGWNHSMAVTSDGNGWSWGHEFYGSLGGGDGQPRNVPGPFLCALPLAGISGGSNHSLAVSTGGAVYACGRNGWGQLGEPTADPYYNPTPLAVTALPSGCSALKASLYFSLVLKDNGTVWSFGRNDAGQLGDGTNVEKPMPVEVSGLTNVTRIEAGGGHGLALKSDGIIWTWGSNGSGRLGDGTWNSSNVPVQVVDLTDATAVAGGGGFSAAIKR